MRKLMSWSFVVALFFSVLPVAGLAAGDTDPEVNILETNIREKGFLKRVRNESRGDNSDMQRETERLRAFLAEVKPWLKRWHGLYYGIRSSLRPAGSQLSVDAILGVMAGVGLRVGLGIEDRALVQRPHVFLHALWSYPDNARSRDDVGIIALLASITSRSYTSADGARPGQPADSDPENSGAAVLGYGRSNGGGAIKSQTFSFNVGIGSSRHGAANLLTIELPAFLWPLPHATRGLLRKTLLLEYELIYHTQRLDYAEAERAFVAFQTSVNALQRAVSSRLVDGVKDTELSSAHPMSSVRMLFSESAVRRYQKGTLRRFFRSCAVHLGMSE